MTIKVLILVCLGISVFEILPESIVIDLNREDKLNLSDIEEKTTVVSLTDIEIKNPGAAKVFLIDENIFILQRFQEYGVHYSNVSRFDLSGNFKGLLVTKDPETGESLNITEMYYNNTDKSVFLVFSSGYGIYDKSGNFISYHKFKWANGDNYILASDMLIFKGQIWFEEITRNTKSINVNFVHADLHFQNKETVKQLASFNSDYKGELPSLYLSTQSNELYVSFQSDNVIYRVNQRELTPFIRFEFKDRSMIKSEITLNQKMVGKYVKNGYWHNFTEYDFLYDKENRKSYNIKYLHNSDMIFTSGITDDIYNTGYFKFNPTNREDYIYFLKNRAELKDSKLFDPKKSGQILFLVKLK